MIHAHKEEYQLIDKPFRQGLFSRFLNSLLKRRILQVWRKQKQQIKMKVVRYGITTDEQFIPLLQDLFQELSPLLLRSFREEYPNRRPDPSALRRWIADCMFSCEVLGKTKDRNTWAEIYDFYLMVQEKGTG